MCVHWWRIEIPEGPTSRGKCSRCGDEREFRNSEDYYGPEHRVKAHVMYSSPGEKLRMAEAYQE